MPVFNVTLDSSGVVTGVRQAENALIELEKKTDSLSKKISGVIRDVTPQLVKLVPKAFKSAVPIIGLLVEQFVSLADVEMASAKAGRKYSDIIEKLKGNAEEAAHAFDTMDNSIRNMSSAQAGFEAGRISVELAKVQKELLNMRSLKEKLPATMLGGVSADMAGPFDEWIQKIVAGKIGADKFRDKIFTLGANMGEAGQEQVARLVNISYVLEAQRYLLEEYETKAKIATSATQSLGLAMQQTAERWQPHKTDGSALQWLEQLVSGTDVVTQGRMADILALARKEVEKLHESSENLRAEGNIEQANQLDAYLKIIEAGLSEREAQHSAHAATMARQEEKSSSDTLQTQVSFWQEYSRLTGQGYAEYLRQSEESLRKRKDAYVKAGIDELTAERWLQEQLRDLRAENPVQQQVGQSRRDLRLGDGDFNDVTTASLGGLVENYRNMAFGLSEVWGGFFSDFTTGFSNSVGQAIWQSENLGDALYNISSGALSSLTSGLVNLGIQWGINQMMQEASTQSTIVGTAAQSTAIAGLSAASTTAIATEQATSTAAAAETTAAWAPAAAVSSIGSFGVAAAIALTGIAAVMALTRGFEKGGYTGNLGRRKVAGVVHGQEFVFDAQAVDRIGVGPLEALRSGSDMFSGSSASYGQSEALAAKALQRERDLSRLLQYSPVSRSPDYSGGANLNVSIENYGTSKEFEVQRLSPEDVRIIARDVVRAETPRLVSREIANPNSDISKGFAHSTRLERRR
ncbi:MAG: hypothetical protein LBV80_10920 [Deltaproteobacteria bacterium]|jgi:hypothetical protein|nr:hypothetical protein [Deltaproteobacteria bacterium]